MENEKDDNRFGNSTILEVHGQWNRCQGELVKSELGGKKQMRVNEYQEVAMATLNPMLDKKNVLINSVMGLCGESGEVIDIVKKWLMQGHELDKEHLIKRVG